MQSVLRRSALSVLGLGASVCGQHLVADIHPGAEARPSLPHQFVPSGTTMFFVANGGQGGELYATDGTANGTRLVLDIRSGTAGGMPLSITDLDGAGRVVFSAEDATHGREPWVSDGTAAGTFRLADVSPGASGSNPEGLFRVGSRVFFAADDGVHGRELWVTDGTSTGTYRVLDLNPGAASGCLGYGAELNGMAVFLGDDGTTGWEAWTTDGTRGNATLLVDALPGAGGGGFHGPSDLGSGMLFASFDPSRGPSLWLTGGTPATTRLVADLSAFTRGAFGSYGVWNGSWFGVNSGELWVSDGTAANTRRITASTSMESPADLVPAASGMLFTASSPATGRELWISDGTNTGTRMVADLAPGSASGVRGAPGRFGPGVIFNGNDGGSGNEPWVSDGRVVARVHDIGSGAQGLDPSGFAWWPARAAAVFAGDDGVTGEEPWITLGTSAGTRLLADLRRGQGLSSNPSAMVPFEGDMYFFAETPASGSELWRGQEPGGATQLEDLVPGPSGSQGRILAVWRDALYLSARDAQGSKLFRTDGSVGGATALGSFEPIFEGVALRDGVVFSSAPTSSPGNRELWSTDGTPGGTRLVFDLNSQAGSNPRHLHRVGDRVVFVATGLGVGDELYGSDGTTGGTSLLVDLTPGPSSSTFVGFRQVGDLLFFTTSTPATGHELFVTDGTPAGTRMVRDINPGPTPSSPADLTAWRGELWFVATDSGLDREIWRSDGTAAGTVRAVEVVPGPASAQPTRLTPTRDALFFTANRLPTGHELRKTDGTAAGTSRLRTFTSTSSIASIDNLTAVGAGTTVLFAVDDGGGAGLELWTSDGTSAGTRSVGDLNPDGDSRPHSFGVAGRSVWFLATTFAAGKEPWVMDASVIGASLAEPIGFGCSGIATAPRLGVVGAPRLGDLAFGLVIDGARPTSLAALVLGTGSARVPLVAGCELRVGGSLAVLVGPTDARGSASFSLPVPADPVLAGVELWSQGVAADPTGPLPGGSSLTPGLRLLFGEH